MSEYVDPQVYPKAKYKFGQQPFLVSSPAEEEALGPEWVDHPNLAVEPVVVVEQAAEPEKKGKKAKAESEPE